MRAFHLDQQQGVVKIMPANNSESIKDKHFEGFIGHEIPTVEGHLYHVAMEMRVFEPNTGEKLSKSSVKKYTPEMFEFQKNHGGFKGYQVHVLHNPSSVEFKNLGLIDLNGIGDATAKILKEAGVDTLEKLAVIEEENAKEFSESTEGITFKDMKNWIAQAKKSILG